jgi:hypothetical protein
MRYLFKFTPELILACYILLFLQFKHPGNSWERVINSDGKGYYAYLPALFIYHDLNYKFLEHYEAKYYPADKLVFKEFRIKTADGIVNKCFPGLAIVWLPFFLIAHLLSTLFGFEPDGYSLIYQYAIAFSALFYLWLGCRFLFKLLVNIEASEKDAAFITLLIGLGTNLIFYTIIEGSMTHVYSFGLITLFLYSVLKLVKSNQGFWFLFSCFLFALIVLIRPVNAMILLLVPFMASLARLSALGSRLSVISKKHPAFIFHPPSSILHPSTSILRYLLSGLIILLLFFSIPLLLWHYNTGHWIVYTYGNERFDFLNPHFFQILFSYNRGWFVYTPVAFIAMAGFIGLYKENKTSFFWLLAFLFIFIYVCSSWWMWYYASKCGQRIFIDILVVPAILLFYLLKWIQPWKIVRNLLRTILFFLIFLNLVQSYQHSRWIFPSIDINAKIYWNAFFSFHPVARIAIPEKAVIGMKSFSHDMEKVQDWMNEGTINHLFAFSGSKSSLIKTSSPYSSGLVIRTDTLFSSENRVILIKAMVLALGSKNGALLVADFGDKKKSLYYKAFYCEPFAIPHKWTKIETAFYIPADMGKNGIVKIYFYLPPGNDPFLIDDLRIDLLSLKDEKIYSKIDGILIPSR